VSFNGVTEPMCGRLERGSWMSCKVVSAIMRFKAWSNQCPLLLCRQKANAGVLTNFEVLDFLRSRGAKIDPMGCLGAVAVSECKVITDLLLFYPMPYRLDFFLDAVLSLK
jgi:hypothetical protein